MRRQQGSSGDSDPIGDAVESLGIIQQEDDPKALAEVKWPQISTDLTTDIGTIDVSQFREILRK